MSKIDWTKRRLFSDIPGQADSDLVDMYTGSISTFEQIEDSIYPVTYHVYVVPNRAVYGGNGKEGWIYMVHRSPSMGYTPSKVYKSLQQCIGAAQNALLDIVSEDCKESDD